MRRIAEGRAPGFVQALDEHRLAWADLAGNNRLDSFENLVTNDGVALLFLIPGMDETLRVNGRAELTTDPELCERVAVDGKPARAVVVVTVEEAYVHCAKAFRRSALWSTDTWLDPSDLPNAACMLKDHGAIDVDASVIEDALDRDAEATLWEPGGRGPMAGCVFCSIVAGETPAHVVLDDEVALGVPRHPAAVPRPRAAWCPATHHETLPDLPAELLGPFFERVQRLAARRAGGHGREGLVRGHEQRGEPERAAPARARRARAPKGDGLRGFFWPRTKYRDDAHAAEVAAAIRARARRQAERLELLDLRRR